jgi:hypothetical protein
VIVSGADHVLGGGGGLEQAAVVVFTCALEEWFPAASRASTPNQYDVPQARPLCADDVDVTDAISVPLRNTSYATTPTLSLEALHVRVSPVCVTLDAARPVGADGGVVSAHPVVATITVAFDERLPAPSTASTDSV